jgi:hypothetical protein
MHRLSVAIEDGVVRIVGNRGGLRGLAEVCLQLADLPETRAESRKLGNHYHFSEQMNSADQGSVEMIILYDPEIQ